MDMKGFLLQNPTIYIAIGTIIAGIITAAIALISSILSKENKISELRQEWINGFRDELSKIISSSDFIIISSEKIRKKEKESLFLDKWIENSKDSKDSKDSKESSLETLYKLCDVKVEIRDFSIAARCSRLFKNQEKQKAILFDTTPISLQEAQILLKENKKTYKLFLESYKKIKLLLLQDESLYYYDFNTALNGIYLYIHTPEKGIAGLIEKQEELLTVSQKIINDEWKKIKEGEFVFKLTKRLSFCLLIIMFLFIAVLFYKQSNVYNIGDILVKIENAYIKDELLIISASYINKGNTSISLYLEDISKIYIENEQGNKFDYIGMKDRNIGDLYLTDLSINEHKVIDFLFGYPNQYNNEHILTGKKNTPTIYILICYAIKQVTEVKNQREVKSYCYKQRYNGVISYKNS